MALIRDPGFWRRFSVAIHRDEEAKGAAEDRELEHSVYSYAPTFIMRIDDTRLLINNRHGWIQRQQQKKRESIIFGFLIAAVICVVVAAVVVVLWWFGTHHWLRESEKEHS